MLFHCAAFLSAISRSPLSSRMSWRHHRFGLVRLISLPIYGHKTAEASLGVISEDLGALGCKLDAACQGYMGTGREMRKEFRENICRFCDLCCVWEAEKRWIKHDSEEENWKLEEYGDSCGMLICKATGRSYFWKKCIFRLVFTSCDANIAFKDLSPPNAFHQVRLFYLKCIFRTIKIGPVAQLLGVYATDNPSRRHQNLLLQNYLLSSWA